MEQELGNGWAENVHPDDFDRCLQTYISAFDARKAFSMEYRLRRHDGEYRWLLDNGTPLFGPGNEFAGYIGSCVDISDHKQAEDALQEAMQHLKIVTNSMSAPSPVAAVTCATFGLASPTPTGSGGSRTRSWASPSAT